LKATTIDPLRPAASSSPAEAIAPQATEPAFAWRSELYAWFVVVVLALSLTLSLVDRMILALLVGPIKRDMGLTDTQISLLLGFAFTVLYVIAGLPLGRLADQWSRRAIGGCSVFAWSVMTAACGMAGSFGQLFAARMGVGVGEAGLSPAAVSMVGDYFPPQRRAKPLAFISIGATVGGGLSLVVGGAVLQFIGSEPMREIPFVGPVRSWQAVFFVLGAIGVLFSLIFLAVREPPRSERIQSVPAALPVREIAGYLRVHRRFFLSHFMGGSLAVMLLISFHVWMPTLLARSFGWSGVQAGYVYGLAIAIGGATGVIGAGVLADRLVSRGRADGHFIVAWIAALAAFVPLTLGPLMPAPELCVALVAVSVALLTMPVALVPVALQTMCPNEMRGQVFAVYLFVMSLLGYGVGPLLVAALTDFVFESEAMVRYSLAVVAVIGVPLCALSIRSARRHFHRMAVGASNV
jgi:MFS family permease